MILDTNAVSALFAGEPEIAAVLEVSERHELPVIVLGEYRYGLLRSRYRETLETLLDRLVEESNVLGIDETTAAIYAEVREKLRERGTPIPENDVWISALAMQHGTEILSQDEHFDRVEGVERVSWRASP